MDYNVTGDSYDRVVSMDGVKVIRYQAGTVAYVFNKKEGVASNIYFRQAVNAALNFDDVMRAAYGSLYELNSSYMDSSEPFWVSEAGSEYYNQHDAAKAKELLKKAGYNGQPFRILVSTLNGMDRTALVVQQELEAVGIKVELIVVDWATLTQFRTDSSKYDVYVTSFASVPVPSLKLYFGPTYPGWTGTDDPHILSLVDAFNASKTRGGEAQLGCAAGLLVGIPALMNLGHYNAAMAWSDKVENLNIYSGGLLLECPGTRISDWKRRRGFAPFSDGGREGAMKKYVIRRVLSLIPVLLIVSVVVFSIVYLIPGDPAAVILGDNATPEDIMALRTRMGLDDPPVTRYFHWLGNVFSGDLGVSVSNNTPVSEMLKSHMLPTLSLAIYAMIISVVIALPLGMVAARRKQTIVDQSVTVLSLLGITFPVFFSACS
jgi:hypothetical protein